MFHPHESSSTEIRSEWVAMLGNILYEILRDSHIKFPFMREALFCSWVCRLKALGKEYRLSSEKERINSLHSFNIIFLPDFTVVGIWRISKVDDLVAVSISTQLNFFKYRSFFFLSSFSIRGAKRDIKHRSTEVIIITKAVIYVGLSNHRNSIIAFILMWLFIEYMLTAQAFPSKSAETEFAPSVGWIVHTRWSFLMDKAVRVWSRLAPSTQSSNRARGFQSNYSWPWQLFSLELNGEPHSLSALPQVPIR